MTSIKISNQLSSTSTSISNTFIDHFMPPANGEFVKVYLYLIRMASSGQAPTIADMADALNNTESDIVRSLKYWEKQHLLLLHLNAANDIEFIELLPIQVAAEEQTSTLNVVSRKAKLQSPSQEPEQPTLIAVEKPAKPLADVVAMPPAKPNYQMTDLQQAFSQNGLDHLLYEAEILLGKTFTSSDLATLFYIHDQLGFSPDLISYLIEYCVSIGKLSVRYIEKVALSWHENNITTIDDAKNFSDQYSSINNAIKRALGLNSWGEEAGNQVRLWTQEYGMSTDLIIEACNRAYRKTGGDNALSYASAILKNWNQQHITSIAELQRADETFKKNQKNTYKSTGTTKSGFHNFDQGEEVDYDAIIPNIARPIGTNNK